MMASASSNLISRYNALISSSFVRKALAMAAVGALRPAPLPAVGR
ncbi:MAG: hypothetical protein WDO73_34690 [Ignavibacteriota bacterium]